MGKEGRRDFLFAVAGTFLSAPVALAQQPGRKYRVGMLVPVGGAAIPPYRKAVAETLAKHGFVDGRNLEIDARPADQGSQADESIVRELLKAKPDALFTCFTSVTLAAMSATKTTPIVFAWVADPVISGISKTFAAPGGNATGVTNRFGELVTKRIELALEMVPDAKKIALIGGTFGPLWDSIHAQTRKFAATRGVELLEVPVFGSVEGAVASAADQGAQVLIMLFFYISQPISVEVGIRVAREKRIPAIFADAAAVEAGALIALGTNLLDDIRRGADLLARVLKGGNPARLPVDQAARFELVLNLKTARELGPRIPQSVLLRADRVIE